MENNIYSIKHYGFVDKIVIKKRLEIIEIINNFMQTMFKNVGIKLVDFKLEFGRTNIDGKKEFVSG